MSLTPHLSTWVLKWHLGKITHFPVAKVASSGAICEGDSLLTSSVLTYWSSSSQCSQLPVNTLSERVANIAFLSLVDLAFARLCQGPSRIEVEVVTAKELLMMPMPQYPVFSGASRAKDDKDAHHELFYSSFEESLSVRWSSMPKRTSKTLLL
ncbi:hypothetical protein KC19_7G110900 [Ceratodon purpureus]|uniref:Uncharacterized protein n=1 Tax=Ceratodon purpureus TaxID=3225 RepID=A0A8T0H523_CERPU|nr:hypothetical protein KC19_7G110900 [Ceratodon purpureus]